MVNYLLLCALYQYEGIVTPVPFDRTNPVTDLTALNGLVLCSS